MPPRIRNQQQAADYYREQAVLTQSPGGLVMLLYGRLIQDIEQAKAALEKPEKDINVAHQAIMHAQDIVVALTNGLVLEQGDVAKQFLQLYDYCYHELLQANMTKEVSHLRHVEGVIAELSEAWGQII